MKDKINPRLIELANKTYNPNLELPDLEKIVEKQTNQLERDENGKPTIKLTLLKKTVVHTPTQEKYDTLMQVYECGGWRWASEDLPTSLNCWEARGGEMAIKVGTSDKDKKGFLIYGMVGSYESEGFQIISTQEFYNKQNITDNMIKEINNYFKNER